MQEDHWDRELIKSILILTIATALRRSALAWRAAIRSTMEYRVGLGARGRLASRAAEDDLETGLGVALL